MTIKPCVRCGRPVEAPSNACRYCNGSVKDGLRSGSPSPSRPPPLARCGTSISPPPLPKSTASSNGENFVLKVVSEVVRSSFRTPHSQMVAAVVGLLAFVVVAAVAIAWSVDDTVKHAASNSNDSRTSDETFSGDVMPVFATSSSSDSQGMTRPILSHADLTERIDRSVVLIRVANGEGAAIGSGFVVDGQGLVVTNRHVVEDGSEFSVLLHDKSKARAVRLVYAHPTLDLALLRISTSGAMPPPIPLARKLPRKGEDVAVFGSPEGLAFTTSFGNVSALRNDGDATWIQFTAPISPGNSGGPVVNMQGEVVGMATMQFAGERSQNLNFALSAVDIATVLQLSRSGK